MKLHIVFDKNGDKVGDLDSMEYALSKLRLVENSEQELQVNVANGLVIYCFRLLVKQGKIKSSELLFYNKSTDKDLKKPIYIDIKGEISEYPIGFLDAYSYILSQLI